MNAWEIWSYQPPGWSQPHPAVIVSAPQRVLNKPDVNVVMCSTQRATRAAQPNEVILDQADGLNWPTLCKCDLIHVAAKSKIQNYRGRVSDLRRKAIINTIIRSNAWI